MIYFDRGAGPNCNTQELGEKLAHLKKEITKLEEHEQLLDLHKSWIKQSIKNVTEDLSNKKLLYTADKDLYKAFPNCTVLAVQAPLGTDIEVPFPQVESVSIYWFLSTRHQHIFIYRNKI